MLKIGKKYPIIFSDEQECIFTEDSDIISDKGSDDISQILYFCGHHEICNKFNNPLALQLAKSNVEKYYPVIGIVENMNKTLAVLEHFWPEYFKGAVNAYFNEPQVTEFYLPNPYKLPVSENVKKIVRANFTREYEFYDFCKQRLDKQYQEIIN